MCKWEVGFFIYLIIFYGLFVDFGGINFIVCIEIYFLGF